MGKWNDRLALEAANEQMRQDLDSAASLMRVMRDDGFRFEASGESLIVAPKARLTDDRRVLLRAVKPALMALLAIEKAQGRGNEREAT